MLLEVYNLLSKIESGINHKCFVNCFCDSNSLVIRIEYRDSRKKRDYYIQKSISFNKLQYIADEIALIDDFIQEVNETIRINYLS